VTTKRIIAISCLLSVLFVFAMVSTSAQSTDDSLTPLEQLGKHLFFDKISSPDSMSCADCHDPKVGFTGPNPGINKHGAVYRGAVPYRFGNRKPPSAAYATFSPALHYETDISGEMIFIGGNFWDGRATGDILGNPAADQAQGPFLNPVEHNNYDKAAVVMQVASSKYAGLFEEVWGPGSLDDIEGAYDQIALSIAAYEASSEVNQFSSKFDDFWANTQTAGLDLDAMTAANWGTYKGYGLDDGEVEGLMLFHTKALCSQCHVITSPLSHLTPLGDPYPPVFTDFSFDNLGVPKNPENPFYDQDENWIDPGLGGFLNNAGYAPEIYEANLGKHKVPTLRNVAKGPGNGFPKAYMHNGVFKSLKEVVNFYNTRDVEDWPDPEVADNVNTDELGDLGLTGAEEDAIVAFLKTLSDGYKK
jgi:cytochrome c peroxidase